MIDVPAHLHEIVRSEMPRNIRDNLFFDSKLLMSEVVRKLSSSFLDEDKALQPPPAFFQEVALSIWTFSKKMSVNG